MTDPDRSPAYPNPALPRGWRGGVFEGLAPPRDLAWYDEQRHLDPLRRALDGDWSALEHLTEGDPPEVWGLDVGGVGPGGGSAPKRTQTLRGVVRRVAATRTGLVLEEAPGEWLNLSRFSAGVSLQGYGTGDLVEAVVEDGSNGKRYLVGLRRLDAEPGA